MYLGPARIARALLDRGWADEDVVELLRGARVLLLRGLPEDRAGEGTAKS